MKALNLKEKFHNALDEVYGKDEVNSLFFLCLEHICNFTKIKLQLEPEFIINNPEINQFTEVLELLKQQKPIQYIFGETEFFGLQFKVNKDVLIPRQETEELVALILKDIETQDKKSENINILDIGTGSGCIAISLAKNLPKANVYALDVSNKALKITKHNIKLNAVHVSCIEAHILNNDSWSLEFRNLKFDCIVSNPPYVRNLEKIEIEPNVLEHEPHLALFVEDDNPLIFYKVITKFASNNLKPNGSLYFEINQYLGEETKQVLVDNSFVNIELKKDINGNDRIVKGIKKI